METWQIVARRSVELQKALGIDEIKATGMAWREHEEARDRAERLVTIRRENMRKAKVAARRDAQRSAPATFNAIRGLAKLDSK